MSLKNFSTIYNNYVDTKEKKIYAHQINKQLKSSVLLHENELTKKTQSTINRTENEKKGAD